MLPATSRWEIAELVTRADALASRRDAAQYAALFTDDAVIDGAEGTHHGSELRTDVAAIWQREGDVSVHLTLNVEVNQVEGSDDAATTDSVLVILGGEGATRVWNVALITQTVVRVGPSWKISHRTVRSVDSLAEL
ncbi:MAG: nuclear transport factor 2 family protein [Acidimicrobiales bacterium]